MIQGAITGLTLVLIAWLGTQLFKIVPAKKQKAVSFGMAGVGVLLMLTNIPYVFGMIKQSNTLDIVFLVLLFGGGFLAFVGISLKVKNREANNYSKPESKPRSVPHNPVGNFTIALLAVTLALMKLALFLTTDTKPKRANFRLPEARIAVTEVKSIDEATQLVIDGYASEKLLAWEFLIDRRDAAPDRVSEIGVCLAQAADDGFAEDLTVQALDDWFCPDMAKCLVERLEHGELSALRRELHDLFGKNRSISAAEYLSNNLREPGATEAIRHIGPETSGFVIRHIHSEKHYQKVNARELLRHWRIAPERLIQASIDELRTKNGQSIKIVAPFLNSLVSQANETQLAELAELMEQIIVDPNIDIDRSVVKLIRNCARTPETPAAVLSGIQLRDASIEKKASSGDRKFRFIGSQWAVVRKEMERLLQLYPSPEIENAMIDAWRKGRGGIEYMSKNESPTLAKTVAASWHTLEGSQLEKIRSLQFKVPAAIPIVFEFCFEDLKSDDTMKVSKGIDWLEIYGKGNQIYSLRPKVFKPYKSSVETAIRNKMSRLGEFEPSLAKRIIHVAKLWKIDNEPIDKE